MNGGVYVVVLLVNDLTFGMHLCSNPCSCSHLEYYDQPWVHGKQYVFDIDVVFEVAITKIVLREALQVVVLKYMFG